jgi:SAM-dependent methyltransferase
LHALLRPRDFASWDDYYWSYQRTLAARTLVPLLRQWGLWDEGVRVLDVGCGLGGASFALAEAGAAVDGVEIVPRLAAGARARCGERLRVVEGDITRADTLAGLSTVYDIVLFRDVLEHIPDSDGALAESVGRLAGRGAVVVVYPPWWSAFGGHQQTLPAQRTMGVAWGKLPFVHWLPAGWGRRLARLQVGDAAWSELLTIRRAHLSMAAMSRRAGRHGLRLRHERLFLSRPSHTLRYGVPTVGAGWLAKIPLLREVIVSGSYQCFERE